MQDDIFLMLEMVRVPFSEIEGTLGMPKNYLSRFKNPKYNMPLKWINAITEYLEREFEIEIYCKQNNCTKRDLIELHKKYKDYDFSDLKDKAKVEKEEYVKVSDSNNKANIELIESKEKVDYKKIYKTCKNSKEKEVLWRQIELDSNLTELQKKMWRVDLID